MLAQDSDGAERQADLRVLLVTEGSYPFHFSGVSSWCRNLVTGLPDVDFQILALVADPDLSPLFELPANVSALTTVPIWGVREVAETPAALAPAGQAARRPLDQQALDDGLRQPLHQFVTALFSTSADPFALAHEVNALYEFFLVHDLDSSMRSAAAWEAFVAAAETSFPAAAKAAGYADVPIGVSDAVTGLHWLYHWLLPLSRELPEVDVAHVTMAGDCVLPAVASKLHHGSGFVFSEHGVHLREIYLREADDDGSLFLKLLKIGFARRTTEMAYAVADQISTCCEYNKRWELRNGASPERLQTIHYGLDATAFEESQTPADQAPVITWLGRIDPLKDLETLLYAAEIVHRTHPDAVFRLHGSAGPEQSGYRDRLLTLRGELGLGDVVELPGYTSDPQGAFSEADIVVLSSISEGFPYATLEAMLCGKPVVATAVGGLDEQLGDCGVLVEPQSPAPLAAALIDLIDDPTARVELGGRARARVRELFSLEQKNRLHFEAYEAAADAQGRELPSSGSPPAQSDDAAAPSGAADGALVEEITAQVPHPVDDREIAAVLEARGVTDAVAQSRHGAGDVFELAAAIFARVRGGGVAPRPHQLDAARRAPRSIPYAVDGLLMLFPAAVLLSVGHWVRSIHGWTSGTSRALLVGVAVSSLFGNAFLFALMRRGALLIGCERWGTMRRFLWRSSVAALLVLFAADLIAVSVASAVGHPSSAVLTTFGLSFAALAGLWILSGGLVLVRRAHEVGLATLGGVAVGVVIYYATGSGSTTHLEIALGVGYAVMIAIVTARATVSVGQGPRTPAAPKLPRLSYLVREASPFAAYGALLIALVLGPNLVTALRASAGGSSNLRSVAVGMTVALVPLMLSIPLAEDGLFALSAKISAVLSETGIGQAEEVVGEHVRDFHRRRSLRYITEVTLISLIAVPLLWLLADVGALGGLGVHSTGALLFAFVISALAYLLLALAQFDVVPAITLARPDLGLRCLLGGIVATAVVAAVVFPLGFLQAGPVALFAGTSVFAVLATRTSDRLFARVTSHLVGAM